MQTTTVQDPDRLERQARHLVEHPLHSTIDGEHESHSPIRMTEDRLPALTQLSPRQPREEAPHTVSPRGGRTSRLRVQAASSGGSKYLKRSVEDALLELEARRNSAAVLGLSKMEQQTLALARTVGEREKTIKSLRVEMRERVASLDGVIAALRAEAEEEKARRAELAKAAIDKLQAERAADAARHAALLADREGVIQKMRQERMDMEALRVAEMAKLAVEIEEAKKEGLAAAAEELNKERAAREAIASELEKQRSGLSTLASELDAERIEKSNLTAALDEERAARNAAADALEKEREAHAAAAAAHEAAKAKARQAAAASMGRVWSTAAKGAVKVAARDSSIEALKAEAERDAANTRAEKEALVSDNAALATLVTQHEDTIASHERVVCAMPHL